MQQVSGSAMPNSLKEILPTKERQIADLIQFVKTRTGNVSNYTLLLGAGASASSGVRTASELVDTWRNELYERYSTCKEPYSASAARTFFSREHSQWYSLQREYA